MSKPDKGIIKREHRLGYLQLPFGMNLKQEFDISDWHPGHD